jgi:hypothetical protein
VGGRRLGLSAAQPREPEQQIAVACAAAAHDQAVLAQTQVLDRGNDRDGRELGESRLHVFGAARRVGPEVPPEPREVVRAPKIRARWTRNSAMQASTPSTLVPEMSPR